MEEEEAFKLAAERALPAAVTAESGGSGRYAIGNIVFHAAKPNIVSWRKQNLQFSHSENGDAVSLTDILTPDCGAPLSRLRPQSTLFANTGTRATTREFTTTNCKAGRAVTIKADFGAIYQTTSNLLGILDSATGRLKAESEHAAVQKVLENEGHFFVVSTLYEAEKLEICVREEATGDGEVQWRNVYSKHEKTVLAILLLRLHIGSDGVIRAVHHGGYTPSSLLIKDSIDLGGSAEHGGDIEDKDSDYMYTHYQCGRRELQVYLSDTYAGVVEEAAEFVKALTIDKTLQAAFIAELQKPGDRLLKLSEELHTLQEKLLSQSGEGESETYFSELLGHLSTSSTHTLDQVKALTIATEAFRELFEVDAKQIISLTAEEKKRLFDLFIKMPLSHSAHTFSTPALPDSDPLYSQILRKIGFGNYNGHLSYADELGVDLIAIAITAIQATTVESVI